MANTKTAENDSSVENAETTEKEKLKLEVKINKKSACERHLTVTVSRDDIDRYFNESLKGMMPNAQVPGFRAGRAPRKLVESRFRKDMTDQVKGSLLMDSLEQITEEHSLTPISEPNFDPTAVIVPDEGPMTYEFDIEVRPEFKLPNWKGLNIKKPTKKFTKADIDKQINRLLENHGRLEPSEKPAQPGDYLSLNLTFKDGDDVISSVKEEVIRIRPVLSFRDGNIEKFDKLMKGVKAGETRAGEAKLSEDAPNEKLRGKKVTAEFEILEVKKLIPRELDEAFLKELGGFTNEGELRDALQENLNRRLNYQQQQEVRHQVTAALTESADWDLPPALLRRQATRELERSIMELRRSGFGEDEVRAHLNELRQNSLSSTARSLKEHFILERIAEEEKVEDTPDDYDTEIALIAQQSNESPRRVRSQLEKKGLMDALRNQIVERKVIDLILAEATFEEVPFKIEETDSEAMDQSAGGEEETTGDSNE